LLEACVWIDLGKFLGIGSAAEGEIELELMEILGETKLIGARGREEGWWRGGSAGADARIFGVKGFAVAEGDGGKRAVGVGEQGESGFGE